MAVEYLGTGNDDGVLLGRSSTDKIGFYGLATPIVRRSGSAMTSMSSLISTQTSPFGFSTSALLNELLDQVREIRATLVALGLHAGS